MNNGHEPSELNNGHEPSEPSEPIYIDAETHNADWTKQRPHTVEVWWENENHRSTYQCSGWTLEGEWLQILNPDTLPGRVLFIPVAAIETFSVPLLLQRTNEGEDR